MFPLSAAKGHQSNSTWGCNNLHLSRTCCCQALQHLQTVFNESSQLPSGGVTRNIPSLQMRTPRPREAGNLPLAPQLGCEAGRFNVSTVESLCSPPHTHHTLSTTVPHTLRPTPVQTLPAQRTLEIPDHPTAFAAEKTDLMR